MKKLSATTTTAGTLTLENISETLLEYTAGFNSLTYKGIPVVHNPSISEGDVYFYNDGTGASSLTGTTIRYNYNIVDPQPESPIDKALQQTQELLDKKPDILV